MNGWMKINDYCGNCRNLDEYYKDHKELFHTFYSRWKTKLCWGVKDYNYSGNLCIVAPLSFREELKIILSEMVEKLDDFPIEFLSGCELFIELDIDDTLMRILEGGYQL